MRGAAVIYAPCIDQGLSAGMAFLARITMGWMVMSIDTGSKSFTTQLM